MAHLNATSVLQSMIGASLTVIIKEPVTVLSLVGFLFWQQPGVSTETRVYPGSSETSRVV